MEDDILCGHAFGELAFDVELHGLRDLEPRFTRRIRDTGVGGAHARRERAERTVGAGVGVRPDDQVARDDDALLGQQRMLHAHAPDLPVVGDPLLGDELAHLLGLLGRLDVLVRRVMVGHERDARGIPHLIDAGPLEYIDGDRSGHIV